MSSIDFAALRSEAVKPKFLKVSKEGTYRIRCVDIPFRFYVKWMSKLSSRQYISLEEYDKLKNAISSERVTQRLAVNAIHRGGSMGEDELVVVEGPLSLFQPIANYAKHTQINPSDPEKGVDFVIDTTGSGIHLRYSVQSLNNTPFNDNDKRLAKECVNLNAYYGLLDVVNMTKDQLKLHIQSLMDRFSREQPADLLAELRNQ